VIRQEKKPEEVICQYTTTSQGSLNPEGDNSETALKEVRLIEYIVRDN
jgi:hypothetical protein